MVLKEIDCGCIRPPWGSGANGALGKISRLVDTEFPAGTKCFFLLQGVVTHRDAAIFFSGGRNDCDPEAFGGTDPIRKGKIPAISRTSLLAGGPRVCIGAGFENPMMEATAC